MQLSPISFFALIIPISAILAERGGERALLWIPHHFRFRFGHGPILPRDRGGGATMALVWR